MSASSKPPPTAVTPALTPDMVETMLDEVPSLLVLRRFARKAAGTPWFKTVGEPLTTEVRETAYAYLGALGFPDVALVPVPSWEEAAGTAESLDWNAPDWEAEEQLAAALTSQALERMSEEALSVALAHVTRTVSAGLRENIEDMAALWEIADEALTQAAAGAIVRAAHQAALALAADAGPDHPLALKFHLFELGRWPIAVTGTTFNLF